MVNFLANTPFFYFFTPAHISSERRAIRIPAMRLIKTDGSVAVGVILFITRAPPPPSVSHGRLSGRRRCNPERISRARAHLSLTHSHTRSRSRMHHPLVSTASHPGENARRSAGNGSDGGSDGGSVALSVRVFYSI